MKLFSIGETTSGELRNYTQEKIFTSEENTLTSIFDLIRKEIESTI
jgi:uroporphyrinogen-III synthase